jgi:mono/diheme cytochrome c family protein
MTAFGALRKSALLIAALAGASMLVGLAAGGEDTKPTQPDSSLVAQGEYLARAGDCIACHTAPEGKPFAGGLPMSTPFGTLYTSNITPDRETGIGTWTADQFYAMLHTGRFPDGGLLYPAMPFGSYTKVTRPDSDAIFAYLKTIPPVRQPNRPHDLTFPFNNRSLILGWRTLFFKEGEYEPDPSQSAEWNRGAYLIEGLGHCGMCHTAINALGGAARNQKRSRAA